MLLETFLLCTPASLSHKVAVVVSYPLQRPPVGISLSSHGLKRGLGTEILCNHREDTGLLWECHRNNPTFFRGLEIYSSAVVMDWSSVELEMEAETG